MNFMKKKYVYLVMLALVVLSLTLTLFDKQPRLLNTVVLIGMMYLIITDGKDKK